MASSLFVVIYLCYGISRPFLQAVNLGKKGHSIVVQRLSVLWLSRLVLPCKILYKVLNKHKEFVAIYIIMYICRKILSKQTAKNV